MNRKSASPAIVTQPGARKRLVLAAAVIGFLLASPMSPAAPPAETAVANTAPPDALSIDSGQRRAIEELLKREIQRVVNSQERIEGQQKNVEVREVRFDRISEERNAETFLVVEMSKGYIPMSPSYITGERSTGALFEDLLHELETSIHELLREVVGITGVHLLFDGKDLLHYFPVDLPPDGSPSDRSLAGLSVVSAGHEIYYVSSPRAVPW